MSFAERHGFIEIKPIQIDGMDEALNHRLCNAIHKFLKDSHNIERELEYVVDKLGIRVGGNEYMNWNIVDMILNPKSGSKWYMPYEVIECFFAAKRNGCKACKSFIHKDCSTCRELVWFENFPIVINRILEEEKSGFRLVDDQFVNITDEAELSCISGVVNSAFTSVSTHIKKALSLYSDRKNPDYENSIKESISAVEAMCSIITGMTGASATLGATLKKLEDNGVVIHGALREAFSKMYGYTSDANGIRHGGIDFKNAPAEDAKYMLISCSAFVNYLIEKYSKISGSN